MRNSLVLLCGVLAAAFAGCRVVEVENLGDGKGWRVYHNQHWMSTRTDTLRAEIRKDGTIVFSMNGLNTEPSENLNELVATSLQGVATLAAKVGAAIATSGGTTGADAIGGWIKSFMAAGGDADKATVSCAGGSCTISDGTITCKDGVCQDKE